MAAPETGENRDRLALSAGFTSALAALLVVAVLANGSGFYLRRTGVVDAASYAEFWARYCYPEEDPPFREREWQCRTYTSPEAIAALRPPKPNAVWYRYTYDLTPFERGMKLIKDAFAAILVASSMVLLAAKRATAPRLTEATPVYLLLGAVSLSFLASLVLHDPLVAAAGVRSFLFLGVALWAGWLLPRIGILVSALGMLLVVEAALVPFELVRGIHVFGHAGWFDLPARAAATLSQPNSLGVFAVVATAFCFCFAKAPRRLWPLGLVAAALAVSAGSGAGVVCVVAAAVGLGSRAWVRRHPSRNRVVAGAAVVFFAAIVLLVLPFVTGRPDFYASIGAGSERMVALRHALFERDLPEVIFGSGLGVNTNAALNLMGARGLNVLGSATPLQALPPDSTVTALLVQLGVLGTMLFYFAIAWAARADERARPFYAVVAACSLTINITELFPVNALLGIALAHSIAARQRRVPA